MFTPAQTMREEPKEVWLLTGAWLFGASMDAVMTWYAVALTISTRSVGAGVISQADMLRYAPLFVALLVWVTRILLIGSIALTMDRLLHQGSRAYSRPRQRPMREGSRGRMSSPNGDESYAEELFDV